VNKYALFFIARLGGTVREAPPIFGSEIRKSPLVIEIVGVTPNFA
jgi:hypothetical protein